MAIIIVYCVFCFFFMIGYLINNAMKNNGNTFNHKVLMISLLLISPVFLPILVGRGWGDLEDFIDGVDDAE